MQDTFSLESLEKSLQELQQQKERLDTLIRLTKQKIEELTNMNKSLLCAIELLNQNKPVAVYAEPGISDYLWFFSEDKKDAVTKMRAARKESYAWNPYAEFEKKHEHQLAFTKQHLKCGLIMKSGVATIKAETNDASTNPFSLKTWVLQDFGETEEMEVLLQKTNEKERVTVVCDRTFKEYANTLRTGEDWSSIEEIDKTTISMPVRLVVFYPTK